MLCFFYLKRFFQISLSCFGYYDIIINKLFCGGGIVLSRKYISVLLLIFTVVFLLTGCSGPFSLNPSDYITLFASDKMLRTQVASANLKNLDRKYNIGRLTEDNDYSKIMKDLDKSREGELDFKLHYISSPVVNALYIGDGHIVLFEGLLEKLNEKQVAAVIAHEMGHGISNHIVESVRSQVGYKITNDILTEMEIDRTVRGISLHFIRNGFSREDEKEADLTSLKILKKSGYDPYLAIEVMEVLNNLQGSVDSKLLEVFQTHPLPSTRIDYMKESLENDV